MTRIVLTVAGRRFYSLSDVDELKQNILTAVRAGGDFITVPTSEGAVDVLITPSTPVTFDHRGELPDDEVPDEEHVAAGATSVEFVFPSFDEFGI